MRGSDICREGFWEQWKDIATYASRVCAIALIAKRAFASDFAVDVAGERRWSAWPQ